MASGKVPNYHFHHPKLGDLVGLGRGSDVVQFRGIPYASIPARFRQSIVASALPTQPFDARRPGPICPQAPQPYPAYWNAPPPDGYPCLPLPLQDEFDCLNLNITAPRETLENHEAGFEVPVMIFIHGGAFIGGSQSVQIAGREVYDPANFVASSITQGMPVIVITINYRLGALGFLASEELIRESRENGEAIGNYGLHDQRQAIAWVARFISGFGGDPGRVTVSGTSAGGTACHFLTTFPDRQFQSAIIASGTIIGIGPRPLAWHQEKFDSLRDTFAAGSPNPVEELRNVPIAEILATLGPPLYNPLIDHDWISGGTMDHILARPDTQPRPALMIGATEFERDLTMHMLSDFSKPPPHLPKSDDEIVAYASLVFSSASMVTPSVWKDFPYSVPAVAESYGMERDQEACNSFANWADLMADVTFRTPPIHIATEMTEHQNKLGIIDAPPILVYEIRAGNPYKGWPLGYRRANHAVNDLMLFNPAEDLVPPELLNDWKGAVAQIQSAWLDFCYGNMPWEPFDQATDSDGFGPVFVFQDGARGKLCRSMAEIDGFQTAVRWRALLEVARE